MRLFGRRVADMPTAEETYYARKGAARARRWAATTTGTTEAAAERGRHEAAVAKVARWTKGNR